MKVEITLEQSYTLQIGSTSFTKMIKVSEWNGFLELKNESGMTAILVSGLGPMAKAFRDAIDPTAKQQWVLVRASPEILAAGEVA
jgi:hypothetical protein